MAPAPVLGLRFVAALALLVLGTAWIPELAVAAGWPAGADSVTPYEQSMLAFLLAAAAVAAFAAFQPIGAPWRPARARAVVAAYVPFAVVWIGALLGYLAAARALGWPVDAQPGLDYLAAGDPARGGYWVVVVAVAAGAPVAEEIVFRGYLQGALQQLLPGWAAIAAAAAVFGLVHGMQYALPVGLLGCLFGWLRWRHGSLWPSVLAHALHNTLTSLITVLWPESLELLYHP